MKKYVTAKKKRIPRICKLLGSLLQRTAALSLNPMNMGEAPGRS